MTSRRTQLDIAASPPSASGARPLERARAGLNAGNVTAVISFLVAEIVYIRTLLPGVSFGDWAESELLHSRLGILHPTGYPLYTLLGKAFSLIPIESLAFRANLLSATAAAAAVGVAVLIAVRLGVRPVIAGGAALALAFTGTIWQEATFSEMNSLHLFLVALLLHRAVVWRDDRRDRDLIIGALLAGLCVSNHGLAITVVPIVVLFVLWDARREIAARPILLAGSVGAFVVGLLPYLYLPLRAMAGPADVYGGFLTWNGFFNHVSGAQFRSDMKFGSIDSVGRAIAAMPQVIDHVVSVSNVVFVALGVLGVVLLVRRDRWFGSLLVILGVINVYIYANYLGDLHHYLLLTWLILTIGLALVAEAVVTAVVSAMGPRAGVLQYAILILPVVLLASNWATPRRVGQPRRRAVRGAGLRGSPAGRRPRHLLGCVDHPQLRALQRGGPARRQPAGLRRIRARHLRPGPAPADRGRQAPTGLRPDDVPQRPPEADRPRPGPDDRQDPRPVRQALCRISTGPLPAGRARRDLVTWRPTTRCSTSAGPGGSSGSGTRVTDRPPPGALGRARRCRRPG